MLTDYYWVTPSPPALFALGGQSDFDLSKSDRYSNTLLLCAGSMRGSLRIYTGLDGRRVILALGALYVVLAVLSPLAAPSENTSFGIVLVVSLLTAVPGSILLCGGYQLPRTSIHPALYDRIAGWCLAGIGVTSVILALYRPVVGC